MHRKMTIMFEEAVYEGLRRSVGSGRWANSLKICCARM